jgi:hypothetical protein
VHGCFQRAIFAKIKFSQKKKEEKIGRETTMAYRVFRKWLKMDLAHFNTKVGGSGNSSPSGFSVYYLLKTFLIGIFRRISR